MYFLGGGLSKTTLKRIHDDKVNKGVRLIMLEIEVLNINNG